MSLSPQATVMDLGERKKRCCGLLGTCGEAETEKRRNGEKQREQNPGGEGLGKTCKTNKHS